MKLSNQKHTTHRTKSAKYLVLVIGISLGIFVISPVGNWVYSTEVLVAQHTRESMDLKHAQQTGSMEEAHVSVHEPKLKTQHNFIASYLLQETSFERKNKKSESNSNLLGYLKQLHKVIISKALGSF